MGDSASKYLASQQPLRTPRAAVGTGIRPSLDEILRETPPDKLDQPCRDKDLCRIAREITDWVFLAPFLGVKAPEVEVIRGKWPYNVRAQNLELLRVWQRKRVRKQKDSYRHLCKALFDAQKVSLVDKVSCVLQSDRNNSESISDESEDEAESVSKKASLTLPDLKPSCTSRHSSPSQDTDSLEPIPILKPSDPLQPLADYLRMTYKRKIPGFLALQWPPPHTLKVCKLALIHCREIVQRRPLDEELVMLTIRGSVDDIVEKKTLIKLEDLFKFMGRKRNMVLVEGAPGSGKSTFAWDICQKWEEQVLFHEEFKVVIYVQLRDLAFQTAEGIADLIPMELESERKKAASSIKSCYGDGVLFVLDGWDEYSPRFKDTYNTLLGTDGQEYGRRLQQGSFLDKLICCPEMLSVPCSTVLVTSRPIASESLQPYATSRVEIVGFTPCEVRSYFEDVFKDPLTVQRLYDHLQERPTIQASCYLPLNAAIVAQLFMETNYTLPTTLHGLFCSLVLSCIIRHFSKDSRDITATSLDDLPSDVQELFKKVCTLAYEGTMCNKVIFTSQDLHSYGLREDLNTLSLMQVVQSLAIGKPRSFYFLHLSVQELLSALHISKLPPVAQGVVFFNLLKSPRFGNVFRFFSALTRLQTEEIRAAVKEVVSIRGGSPTPFNKERLTLHLLHCLYEAQNVSLCRYAISCSGGLRLRDLRLSSFDIIPLKFFLSCIQASPAASTSSESRSSCTCLSWVHITNCELTPDVIDSLPLCNLKSLELSSNRISCACVANLLTNNPKLKHFHLSNCGPTDDGIELFAAALQQHHSLTDLDISCCPELGLRPVLQAMTNHRSLTKLNLSYCTVVMSDVVDMLEKNESLQILKIGRCATRFNTCRGSVITNSDLAMLSSSLKKNRTLIRLNMLLDTLPTAMQEFVWNLKDSHLSKLCMQFCNLSSLQLPNWESDKVEIRIMKFAE